MEAFYPQSPRLDDYLQSTEVVDAHHPAIRDAAARLVSSAGADVAQATLLFEFVRDEIPHTADAGGDATTCLASDVLSQRTGLCYAKSHLLAAMLRFVGIPAGFCYQRLRLDPPAEGFILHGFNGIFLASLGRWIRVDPRGNKPGVDAQFDLSRERLAFPVNEDQGERTYPVIFVEPNPRVVAALRQGHRLSGTWATLPGEL